MAERMTGAEMVIRALQDQGIEHVFGYPGGAVLPIYDALFQQDKIEHILVRHEQGATHAAEGYARSTGKVGVVIVTSGPGATNAVTGITDALLDSVPIVVLSGQVATALIGTDAFQECDTIGITRSCSKHNYLVKNVNDLARVLHEAFYIAATGRPGPVVIDIPKDVQFALGDYTGPERHTIHRSYHPRMDGDIAVIHQQANAENGEIVVAMVEDAVTLKRYYREKNRVRLKAENAAYPPIYTQNVRILGKLTHLIRKYE